MNTLMVDRSTPVEAVGTGRLIYLVSSSCRKRRGSHAAKDMYRSPWFRYARTIAERDASDWFILSGKHGLLAPDTMIGSKDFSITTAPAAERRSWAQGTALELLQTVHPEDTVVLLAGRSYRDGLVQPLRRVGVRVEIPLEGMGIGQQLQWLKQNCLSSAEQAAMEQGSQGGEGQSSQDCLTQNLQDHAADCAPQEDSVGMEDTEDMPPLSSGPDLSISEMVWPSECIDEDEGWADCDEAYGACGDEIPLEMSTSEVAVAGARLQAMQRFYGLVEELCERDGGLSPLATCDRSRSWPEKGVFFLFEDGEERSATGIGPRMSFVGTHAACEADHQSLFDCLQLHRGFGAKGGNHRSSMLRLLLGEALQRRQGLVPWTWGVGSKAPHKVRVIESPYEAEVSELVDRMWLLCLDVGNEPAADAMAEAIAQGATDLLGQAASDPECCDRPTTNWLGLHSHRRSVQDSGLWCRKPFGADFDPSFLDLMERCVRSD